MPRDRPDGLRETAAKPTRSLDQTAVERPGLRQRGTRRVAAAAVAGIVVLGVVVGLATLTGGPPADEVSLEPAPSDPRAEPRPDASAPSPDGDAPPSPGPGEPTVPSPGSEEPTLPSTEPEDPTVPTPGEPAPDVITEEQDGATLLMVPGDTTALRLSNDWVWEQPEVSGAAVVLAPVDYLVDPGYVEWRVEAATSGTSEVTVAGAPDCGDEAACPPLDVSLTFRVESAPEG